MQEAVYVVIVNRGPDQCAYGLFYTAKTANAWAKHNIAPECDWLVSKVYEPKQVKYG